MNLIVFFPAYDVPTIAKYVDWIGVMDYDFHGSWDKVTGHIAPLYFNPGDSEDFLNVDYSIRYWIKAGAPRSKLVMGVPLYGQTFTLAEPANNGLYAPTYGPGRSYLDLSTHSIMPNAQCNSGRYMGQIRAHSKLARFMLHHARSA